MRELCGEIADRGSRKKAVIKKGFRNLR